MVIRFKGVRNIKGEVIRSDLKSFSVNMAVWWDGDLLRELLDIVIVEHVCSDEKEFEKRFGLRYDEPWVRIRVLEASIASEYFSGVDDLTMPQSQFCALSLPVREGVCGGE